AGVPFIECLAALGAVHPVCEKAGMTRVGMCRSSPERAAALRTLRAMGAEPFSADFLSQVCTRPAVRQIVADSVADWYRRTTGGGETRVRRQLPSVLARTFRQLAGSEPVYFIWARDDEGRELIGRGLSQMR